jgi:UDP-glucose 4-epimerase
VLEVVEAARKITGQAIEACKEPRRAGDPSVLVASAEKARRVLGWKPERPGIEDIIGSAWRWHNAHPNGYSARNA